LNKFQFVHERNKLATPNDKFALNIPEKKGKKTGVFHEKYRMFTGHVNIVFTGAGTKK
jgi:hypothetical protein